MTVTWNQLSEIRATPKLFDCLTKLILQRDSDGDHDPRVVSYVLAHAHRLNSLILNLNSTEDKEFSLQLIGAPLPGTLLRLLSNHRCHHRRHMQSAGALSPASYT